jgi:hypothetical protein
MNMSVCKKSNHYCDPHNPDTGKSLKSDPPQTRRQARGKQVAFCEPVPMVEGFENRLEG